LVVHCTTALEVVTLPADRPEIAGGVLSAGGAEIVNAALATALSVIPVWNARALITRLLETVSGAEYRSEDWVGALPSRV